MHHRGGNTPLHYAARNVYTDIVKLLLYAGSDEEVKDRGGKTPLRRVAVEGHTDIVSLLK